MTSRTKPPRAQIFGTGLIGGSIGLALGHLGWLVTGTDRDDRRLDRALELGALDMSGIDADADVTFIATPVTSIPPIVESLDGTGGIVTDVGSVKAPIVAAITHPRFIGGHPMAGSEQEGVDGSDPALFEGATWVLTPTDRTDNASFTRLRSIISSMGANVVALSPEKHDALVALVSHVPHLTAASLMCLAAERAEESGALLRLAAGGFRDMTRVAAGHPGIWPDICAENRDAIVDALDELLGALGDVRAVVADADRDGLLRILERARVARINLPSRAVQAENLVELRVPVPDRPGVLAEVTTLAGELAVNIYDLEIAHSSEGDRGVLLLVIDAAASDLFRGALLARGFRVSATPLGT